MESSYHRTKKHPPEGQRCDASVGMDPKSKKPRVLTCGEPATVELKGGPLPWETWVCEAHAKHLEAKGGGDE